MVEMELARILITDTSDPAIATVPPAANIPFKPTRNPPCADVMIAPAAAIPHTIPRLRTSAIAPEATPRSPH